MCQTRIPRRCNWFAQSSYGRENLNKRTGAQHAMATGMVFEHCWLDETTAVGAILRERSKEFDARFSRCYGLLHFVACRILEGSEGAEEAIECCRVRAFENLPGFEHESAFRSWLVRVLMDEAFAARRKRLIG
jgi:hypothetical protein